MIFMNMKNIYFQIKMPRAFRRFGRGSAARRAQKHQMEKAGIHPSLAYAVAFEQKVEGFSNEIIQKTKIYWNSLQKPVVEDPVVEDPVSIQQVSKQHIYNQHVFKQPVDEFYLFKYYLDRCVQSFNRVAKERLETKQYIDCEKKIAYFQRQLKKEEVRRRESYEKRTGNYRIPKLMREKAVQVYNLIYPSFFDEKLVSFINNSFFILFILNYFNLFSTMKKLKF